MLASLGNMSLSLDNRFLSHRALTLSHQLTFAGSEFNNKWAFLGLLDNYSELYNCL
jgi:hypothetical protein